MMPSLVLCLSLSGCCAAEPPEMPQPKPKPKPDHALGGCYGKVTAIGPDWFEVGAGWAGTRDVTKKQKEDNTRPRRFSAAGTTPGGDPQGVGEGLTYRLIDLKVGDIVNVDTGNTRNGEEFCLRILITRRPGGKIPRMPGELFPEDEREEHLRNQAEQDWEEKGVPIPKIYLNPQGRAPWTNPPYPPVAPMPRAGVPHAGAPPIPPAKP